MQPLKRCVTCLVEKPPLLFGKRGGEYRRRNCKQCCAAEQRRRRDKSPEKVTEYYRKNRERILKQQRQYKELHKDRIREWHRRHKQTTYGITLEQKMLLLNSQGDRCAICGATDPGKNAKDWATDHDHKNGQIRGVLCHSCNQGIGMFQDNPAVLERAAQYIKSPPALGILESWQRN